MRFVILPGQAHDIVGTPELLEDLPFEALIGDKAFDADWLLGELRKRGAEAAKKLGSTIADAMEFEARLR